jgi:hypothetical protein
MNYRIVINGRSRFVEKQRLTYEEVVLLAKRKESDSDELTVTYNKADGPKESGMLFAGKAVTIRNGTAFNAVYTGNA